MLRLSVRLDHVATVRQACQGPAPDPVHAAVLAELGGANGITVHLRSDRRHVQERDVTALRQTVHVAFNLELAPTQEMLHTALAVKPDRVTFVPERRDELTPQCGLDAVLNATQLRPLVRMLQEAGIAAAILVEPELEQVKEAHKLDARAVELDSVPWASAPDARSRDAALRRFCDAARLARKLGLEVLAGRGLGYGDVAAIAVLPEVGEIAVGEAVVARALLVGMEQSVRDMAAVLQAARAGSV